MPGAVGDTVSWLGVSSKTVVLFVSRFKQEVNITKTKTNIYDLMEGMRIFLIRKQPPSGGCSDYIISLSQYVFVWGVKLTHPVVQFVVPNAPRKFTVVKNGSKPAKLAPVNAGEPAFGI